MADFYPYLISSLPMLHFGMNPPFSFERFIDQCSPFLSEKDLHILSHLPKPEQYGEPGDVPLVIQKWITYDHTLRNELVRIRAGKKHLDPGLYLRPIRSFELSGSPTVLLPGSSGSLLDTEKALDETRWKVLDDLATNHFFDLDFLITYAYKLRILLRWKTIRTADGRALLKQTLLEGRNT